MSAQILPAPSYDDAVLLNERATDFYNETVARASGAWSNIYTDGTRYGILFHADVAGGFDPAELNVSEPLTEAWTVFAPEPEPTEEPADAP